MKNGNGTGYLDTQSKCKISEDMRIEWDVPIKMDDGVILRCDVYRPIEDGRYPVIMSVGPYGKWRHFEDTYTSEYHRMFEDYPDTAAGSSNRYQVYELPDPEKWVPDGYVVIRVDSRGSGRSPGVIDLFSPREKKDYVNCIEWAGTQAWSNGKVGLNGISYYSMISWQVATAQPKHLAAMCIWEGAADLYRDMAFHGGMFNNFFIKFWPPAIIDSVQHGKGERGLRSRMNGDLISGPITLSEEELSKNRCNLYDDCLNNPLESSKYWQDRKIDWSKVTVPLLSAGNFGGQGLHGRGNFEGYFRAASDQKWLEAHGREHWTDFYRDYGTKLQKRFFDHFLKGENNGWNEKPRVQLLVRHPGEKFVERHENEWPLARTKWTKFYLHPEDASLSTEPQQSEGSVKYAALSDGVTFMMPPLEADIEITGPIASKLWVSSSTEDADMFLIVRVFTPDMKEIVFKGSADPRTPIAQGWLRASHRKLDKALSLPYRPYHVHDEKQPLDPGQVYELDVEVWPTSIVVPAGYRIGLSVRGKEYVYPGGGLAKKLTIYENAPGAGPFFFQHSDPKDRPESIFGGDVTLHTGPDRQAYVLLPIIPSK